MFRGLQLIPADTKIDFVGQRAITWFVSAFLTVVPLILVATIGLNMGIDFQGGTLIEVKTNESPANLADIRGKISGLREEIRATPRKGEATILIAGRPKKA